MPITLNEKTALIRLCKTEYKLNKAELKVINEFERNYSSDQAIRWYTRGSFLYKMLTKALRNQNIDLLFLFRYVIHDIQFQLEEYKYSSSIHVYRSQLMSKEELQMLKNSLQQFISINSFLSAILDRKAALLLLTNAKVSDDIERVLFEIHVDEDFDGVKAFNNIKSKSFYNQEEILFAIGSIFQLIDIRRDQDNIWIIQMTLSTNNHYQLKPVFEYIKQEYGNTKTSLLSFGLVLQKMNKFDEAEKYYQSLMKILPPKHEDLIKCQVAIDTIFIDKENYIRALNSSNIQTSKKNDYHLIFNLGEHHRKQGDWKSALKSYEKALNISKNCFNDDHQEVGRCYNSMGLVYQADSDYEKALEYYQKAKIILEKHLQSNHPDLSTIYCNIGDMHQYLTDYDQALANYKRSLQIAEQALTPQVPLIISLVNKIAFVYEQKKDFQQALVYYKRVASLLPSAHADLVENEQNIQRVSCQLK
jgi:tetratricopeptide (TPR) repeat protein